MSNLLDAGRITTVYGVKGWVKVLSQTEPPENLFHYQPWYLKTRHGVKAVELVDWRPHGKGFVVQIKGTNDRNQAEQLCPVTVAIDKQDLAPLGDGEYYWYQLEGLRVISLFEQQTYDLGVVQRLLSTGSNDVLVVSADEQSMDDKERLIPYVLDPFIRRISLEEGLIEVDWDPEF